MTNSFTTKKVVALGLGLALAFSAVFATTARAATDEDLQAQISNLLAMIATLQAQLAGGTTGGTTGGSTAAAMQFTLTHKVGDRGGEVMDIQKFLNQDAATMVASSGAGSPGMETSFFGPATKAAVIKFQNKYASEVLAPVGLSQGTGYWGSSSRAKANAMEIARAAAGAGGGTTTPPAGVGSDLTVSAAAQPGNSLAPQSAANVPFTKFTLSAGATAMTFDSVTVELSGLASKLSFASVALLDENGNQVGLTKTLNSNDQATIGETTTIPAGMSKTYTVVGNMNANLSLRAGEVAAFSVVAVNSSSTVAGSLPITGAQHTINATLSIGAATADRGVEDPNSSQSKEIGTANYKFQAVKVTAGSAEDIRVKSVRWNQSGSASAGDIANVMLTFDGQTYTPTVSGDYYTFNFGSGVVIAKGLAKEMVLSADIINGSASSIIFDIRKDTDLVVSGETYGYGITPAAGSTAAASTSSSQFTTSTPWFDGATVTITGGSFNSVSKSNDAPAADVAELVAGTVLGAFTVDIKGESITVETIKFGSQITGGPDASDLTNVTLVDQNGSVLAGPEDGAADAFESTGDADGEGSISFSSVSFPTGITTVFVKGQLSSDFDATDTVVITTNPTDWTSATGDNTGDSITLANSLASANTMTVRAGSLTATTLTQPAAKSVVAGAVDVVFATFLLDAANSGEDVKVTAVVLEDTLPHAADEADTIDNVELWADLTSANSARGDKYETMVSDAEQPDDTGATDETISIALDTQIMITKNTSVEVAVIADVASGATAGDTHTWSLDTDAGDVTAVGVNTGSTISVTPTGAGQTMTVSGGGALTTSVDSSSPSAALVLDDTTSEQTIGVFRLAASNVENLDLDSLIVKAANLPVAKYVIYNGATKIGEKVNSGLVAGAEIFFADGTVTVPVDGNVKLTVKAVLNNITTGGVSNGDSVIAVLDEVQTTGLDSGAAADDTTDRTAETQTVYEAYPVITFDTLANGAVELGVQTIAKIKITNNGSEDVTFQNGDGNSISLQVQVVGDDNDGGASTTETITIKDDNGTVLDTATITSATGTTQIDFLMDSVGDAVGTTIAAGGYEVYTITLDTSDLEDNGDSVRIWLDDADADVDFGIDGAGTFTEGAIIFKGDPTGPTFSRSI